ncbi:DUF1254 domain-containing protein [Culicoidibacter larvae]|uniref:DUF1254 domain-containing protein n=1 Tax=Culicoidibacter larvae TaxID=2579976 RepID=A0A5R8QIX6_9FIRM|nr:DUF1254 domain-containing protein [Culicoidibacter larvae]TLG77207.1 DUF1254 domain-containing protein [Culicoidibacter larvae]
MKTLPSKQEIIRIRRAALKNRAVEAYKFFYPTVSMLTNFDALEQYGAHANSGFLVQLTTPKINALTQNSDTPYGLGVGDTSNGPVVIEVPKGPLMGVIDDANFKYVTDLGLVGEEQGKGAKYLFLPPEYTGDIPDGYIVRQLQTYRFLICLRAVMSTNDLASAFKLMETTKLYPLSDAAQPKANTFQDYSHKTAEASPSLVDGQFQYWLELKRALDTDVLDKDYYQMYGLLADIGIQKDIPFNPSDEMKAILSEAAVEANEQMAINAFAIDDADRIVWNDRKWEWVSFGGDNGYYMDQYLNLSVRERWFYQATLETPKMFVRKEGSGSLYWLGINDADNNFLDGGKNYTLSVPTPVPAQLFWSITAYDIDTRSELVNGEQIPVLGTLRQTFTPDKDGNITLYFGPDKPTVDNAPWIQTVPGKDWFVYFRIYGPTKPAFDNSWKLDDFQIVK